MSHSECCHNTSETSQTTIKYGGHYTSTKEFEDIIVKTTEEGSVLRLKDVARVELSATNLRAENKVDGKPGLTMNITQNSGANASDIDIAIRTNQEDISIPFPFGSKLS